MAEGKKSFQLFTEYKSILDHLTDEEIGIVFRWVFDYVNDLNPEEPKGVLGAIIQPIKNNLKRDLEKWKAKCERNKENGRKGGRPRKNPENPDGFFKNPEKPDKDKDKDKDKDNKEKNIKKRIPNWNENIGVDGLVKE